ncbi:MAG: alpha/beta hydrolase [Candidatus Zixiibacteriota bacterium]
MARLSRQTRENIKIGIFIAVVALLLTVYVVYPLNRSKELMGRENIDDFEQDSVSQNDPTPFAEKGLVIDTVRIESDGLTNLACLYVAPVQTASPARGTVILIPDERQDRRALVGLAARLADTGFAVITYDQRASGLSTGQFHGEGQLEAGDLEAVIGHFELRGKIQHPLVVVGFSAGADAALLARPEGRRIDDIVAANPYLSTDRMFDRLFDRHGTFWYPFRTGITWWWYNIRSGYAAPFRSRDNITAATSRTILILPPEQINDAEVTRFKELSGGELLQVQPGSSSEEEILGSVLLLTSK